jgi:hypothetical protein
MTGGIYLIQDDERLVEMTEQAYNSEALLQKLLVDYPSLLAGDRIDSTTPRRWLLIKPEMEVPSEEDGYGRWFVDHLFLDQDGIPTIVEVKRSCDTRIRREVVGQMLDYASHAVVYWSIEKIITQFEANCQIRGLEPNTLLSHFLVPDRPTLFDLIEDDIQISNFWQRVKDNLQTGKIRLVFVADKIPSELQQIIEFLNRQMNPAEVIGVEIKKFEGQNLKVLIPRVIGQTTAARDKKLYRALREDIQWNASLFFEKLEAKQNTDEVWVARKLYDWIENHQHLQIRWSQGKLGGFYLTQQSNVKEVKLMAVWAITSINNPTATVQICFPELNQIISKQDNTKCLELIQRLNEIPGIAIPINAVNNKYPSFPISQLKDEKALHLFLEIINWITKEIEAM